MGLDSIAYRSRDELYTVSGLSGFCETVTPVNSRIPSIAPVLKQDRVTSAMYLTYVGRESTQAPDRAIG